MPLLNVAVVMTDVGDSYFELQTCTKYLPFKFLHSSGYLNGI
jgi:hypothetical protein